VCSLIVTAKLNEIDPEASLGAVLGRQPGMAASNLQALLPWNWRASERREAA
jgi:hypothetical protein